MRLAAFLSCVALAGCGPTKFLGISKKGTQRYEDNRDFSTGGETAIIRGTKFKDIVCFVESPGGGARELVIDPGPTQIMTSCYVSTLGESLDIPRAVFEFTARNGQEYEIAGRSRFESKLGFGYVDLINKSNEHSLVLRAPFIEQLSYSGAQHWYPGLPTMAKSYIDLMRSNAFISSQCWWNGRTYSRFGHWIRPGRISFEVECRDVSASNKVKHRYVANFEFDVKAGHLYRLDMPKLRKDGCVRVRDLTESEHVVLCQSVIEVE